jgi:hypothetical protein
MHDHRSGLWLTPVAPKSKCSQQTPAASTSRYRRPRVICCSSSLPRLTPSRSPQTSRPSAGEPLAPGETYSVQLAFWAPEAENALAHREEFDLWAGRTVGSGRLSPDQP